MVLSFFKGEGEGYVIELSIILAGGSLRIWKPCETELGRSEMRVKKSRHADDDLVREGETVVLSQTQRCFDSQIHVLLDPVMPGHSLNHVDTPGYDINYN